MRESICTKWALVAILLSVPGCAGTVPAAQEGAAGELKYPTSRRSQQVDRYHGIEVEDPYRWLEEPSDERDAWIVAQQHLLQDFVSGVPRIEDLERRLVEIRRRDFVGIPTRRGEDLFFLRTEAGARHGSLYVSRGEGGEPRRIVDVGRRIVREGHTLGGFSVSRDGRHLVWANLSQGGWGWLEVVDTAEGTPRGERISGVAGSTALWTHDHRGFFYIRYGDFEALEAGEAEPRPEIYYHRLGTDPSRDELVYARHDRPSMLFTPRLSDDGRYLVVRLNDGSRTANEIVYKDLSQDGPFLPLVAPGDAAYFFEGNNGSRFFFRTTLDAPRGRVVAVDLTKPDRGSWSEIIAERDAPLRSVSHIGSRLVVVSTVHARPVVEVWTYDGRKESTLDLPAIGLVSGFADDPTGSVAFYRMNSLLDPGTVFRVDLKTGKSVIHHRPKLAFDPDDYELKQVFYQSADGTRVPMFLAHRKEIPLAGDRPLFMYGFGHSGWVAFPWFQPHLLAWLDLGGTYALPGLRGGGEYGREWQEAGTLLNKPTTIADYVAAAEWLIEKGYTSPGKLVANGGSGSGVVPAAAAVQRPDLFAAALIDFPFLDMLRYHHFTAVKGWTRGYGSSDDAEEFKVLLSYSPLHNLEPGRCYPAMLTVVGEEDTATLPLHGYKFTAALQRAQGCENAALLKLIPGAGHYVYGTTAEAAARTEAEMLAFLIRSLGLGDGEKRL